MDMNNTIEGVNTITRLFSEYGPYIVMGSVFILAFIAILLLFLRMNNKMLSSIMNQVENNNRDSMNITKTLLNKALNKSEEKEEHHHTKNIVQTFMKYRNIFYNAANPKLLSLDANRVAIYLFHNGNSTPYGFPFLKMSCVFDINPRGAKTMRKTVHSNVPIHAFAEIIKNFYDKEMFYKNIKDNDDDDGSLHRFLVNSDSTSVFMKTIMSSENEIVGFTVCEFKETQNYSNKEVFNKIDKAITEINLAVKYIVTNDEDTDEVEGL